MTKMKVTKYAEKMRKEEKREKNNSLLNRIGQ